jgi:release factor glutamine methyltransferase
MASEPPSLTVGEALRQAIRFLSEHGVESPRLTAEVLLSRALGRERVFLYAHPEAPLPELAWIHFGRWLHQRMQGKPLQYITREQEFYGRRFAVGPGVLIPRPETELIVELALRNEATTVLDIGTGSGVLAITLALEWERPTVATDLSAEALGIARANAEALGAPVHLVQADLAAAFAGHSFGAIVTNPPYVPAGDAPGLQREVRDWEPATANRSAGVCSAPAAGCWASLATGRRPPSPSCSKVGGPSNFTPTSPERPACWPRALDSPPANMK